MNLLRTWVDEPIARERRKWSKFAYAEMNVALLQMLARDGDLRPNYTWGVLQAAYLARELGFNATSVLEFGVAGGNGLIALEKAAVDVEKQFGVAVEVYGFDTGIGLPKPTDYRDLPDLYEESTYPMDQDKLRSRLRHAKLIIGLIKETLSSFLQAGPAPVGFVSIDVDLYTSTMDALKLFEANPRVLLPRIHCYLDDMLGFTFSDFTGERLAINEFNQCHPQRKISPIYGLKHFVPDQFFDSMWVESFYLAHIFDHDLYAHDGGLVLKKEENL